MPQTTHQDLSFLQKCTAVRVSFGNLSFSKKLPQAAVRTDTPDADRVKASKKLWDCEEAEEIRKEIGRAGQFVRERTLPSPFGKGIYFVPNTLMEEIDAELSMVESVNIPRLAEALIAVYDRVMQDEQTALGPNFNPLDYDTPGEIRARLRMDYAYLTFGIPENLPNAMYKREQEKAQSRLSEAVDTMQDLLRSEFAKLVQHAAETLTGTNDKGKPKIFRDSLVGNIKDFLQLFRDRNITSDTELEALCDRAKSLLDGVDPADLRKHEPLRTTLANGFAEIRATLDTMLVPRASRTILFDDAPPNQMVTAHSTPEANTAPQAPEQQPETASAAA